MVVPEKVSAAIQTMARAQADELISPTARVLRTAQESIGGGPLVAMPTPEEITGLTATQVEEAWRAGVGSPAGWTLAFVGDFDVENVIPLVERWLASIPSDGAGRPSLEKQVRAIPEADVRGARSVTIPGSEPDQAFTALVVPLRGRRDAAGARMIDRLRAILDARLTARMREDLGETYSVQVGVGELDDHPRLGALVVVFDSSVAARARLVAVAREAIARLRREPPTEAEAASVRAEELSEWAQQSKTHAAWARALARSARGVDPRQMLTRGAEIAATTPDALQAAAKRWLGEGSIDVHSVPLAPAEAASKGASASERP